MCTSKILRYPPVEKQQLQSLSGFKVQRSDGEQVSVNWASQHISGDKTHLGEKQIRQEGFSQHVQKGPVLSLLFFFFFGCYCIYKWTRKKGWKVYKTAGYAAFTYFSLFIRLEVFFNYDESCSVVLWSPKNAGLPECRNTWIFGAVRPIERAHWRLLLTEPANFRFRAPLTWMAQILTVKLVIPWESWFSKNVSHVLQTLLSHF